MRVLPKTRCQTSIGERTRRDRDGRATAKGRPHLTRLRNNYSVVAGRAGVSLSVVDR
jgi:hypothetical protein